MRATNDITATEHDKPIDEKAKIPAAARTNIESIAQIEQQFVRQRSLADRVGQTITRFAGSLSCVACHLLGVGAWIYWNSQAATAGAPFDPFPFSLLGLLVSVEAVLLSSCVLMTQKRQSSQAEHWAHLNLQIALLSEQESTKTLQLIKSICDRLQLPTEHDAELKDLVEKTAVSHLAEELAENLERTRESQSQSGP